MLKRLLIILTLLSFSFVVVLAVGTDDQGNPNDPNDNDRANACFSEGSLEGKCDTDWEWKCGWHLIRFEYELTSREDFPTECASLLPPLPEPEAVDNDAGCYVMARASFYYNGVPNSSGNLAAFESNDCIDGSFSSGIIVVANDESTALAICASAIGGNAVINAASEGFNSPSNLWFCFTGGR